MLTCVKWL